MNVNKSQLMTALIKLRPGLADRDIIEQQVCFRFHGDEIVTFNENILIKYPFSSSLEGGVRADELYRLLSKLPTDVGDIDISIENDSVVLT